MAEALETLAWRGDEEARREGLRRFKRREMLRIAARDLLGFASVEAVGRELAALADACVEATVRWLEPSVPFAVIGMGRLGGRELSYASDLDVLFVYDGSGPGDFDAAEKIATRMRQGDRGHHGRRPDLPDRRQPAPRGQAGPPGPQPGRLPLLLRALGAHLGAPVAPQGPPHRRRPGAGRGVPGLVEPFVYREPFPAEDVREIRRMKARVERERIPPGEDPQFHLKLGRGSLSDVEFTVQLLQLLEGGREPEVRSAVHRRGAAAPRLPGAARPGRRRGAPGGLPVLRTGPEPPLPAHGRAGRLAAHRRRPRPNGSAGSWDTPTSRCPTSGRTTGGSPGGPGRSSNGSSTAASRQLPRGHPGPRVPRGHPGPRATSCG